MDFDDIATALCDSKWAWRPFLFLRPEKDRDMDRALVVQMTGTFGVGGGMLAYLFLVLLTHGRFAPLAETSNELVLAAIVGPVLFYALCQHVLAPSWNRRAQDLRRRAQRTCE